MQASDAWSPRSTRSQELTRRNLERQLDEHEIISDDGLKAQPAEVEDELTRELEQLTEARHQQDRIPDSEPSCMVETDHQEENQSDEKREDDEHVGRISGAGS